jgi:hypothetical protein
MRAQRLGLAFLCVLVTASCATETPVTPTVANQGNPASSNSGSPSAPSVAAAVVDQGTSATYAWHTGDAFLAAVNPAFSPDVAQAPDGDRVVIRGTGTLGIHPKSVSGGGTFTHLSPTGAVRGTGTFTAVELLSFVSYGTSPSTPPSFNSGKALIRVLVFPGGAGSGIDAILRIECMLPGAEDVPNALVEGINLNVAGVANFQQQVSGATVFIKTS